MEKTFTEILHEKLRPHTPARQAGSDIEPMAFLDYEVELKIKNEALQDFWKAHHLPDKPNKVIPSPLPRHYRTTSKRKVFESGGQFLLGIGYSKERKNQITSPLEPQAHAEIYAFLSQKLNSPAYAYIAKRINYLVIRGSYDEFCVIFNLRHLSGEVVRKAKLLGEHLKKIGPKVVSAFIFYDPEESPFYLDQRKPEGIWKLKNIFGPEKLFLKVGETKYLYNPICFSQINVSILPELLDKANQLLKPKAENRLLDLYCGYGLFSHHFAPQFAEVFGIETFGESIESAKAHNTGGKIKRHVQYRAGKIERKTLEKLLPKYGDKPEAILLDPPRQGTEAGVIKKLAERGAQRIVHIFCNTDIIPEELNAWRKSGYMVSKIIPLDMFPGTDKLEVMLLLIPDSFGLLNRIPPPSHEAEAREIKGAAKINPKTGKVSALESLKFATKAEAKYPSKSSFLKKPKASTRFKPKGR